MSKRVNLQDLGAQAAERAALPEPSAATTTSEHEAAQQSHRSAPRRKRSGSTAAAVRFDELERKETRLRADQVEALTQLTRRLNRARHRRGERITENTLIRVAVDLLMSHETQVTGTTETELRKSVSL